MARMSKRAGYAWTSGVNERRGRMSQDWPRGRAVHADWQCERAARTQDWPHGRVANGPRSGRRGRVARTGAAPFALIFERIL
ncbi:hypothetical protein QJS10_CPA08g01313 [Acorus calamus]|uniref:Uncharacterized protein n=1 Tax=Acorus calamus TaxID=4465 RepID=A0AAV9EFR0_ACOCL|nr:hypothetical protein QJS10_CPA08g01313 [Acorus calamus]